MSIKQWFSCCSSFACFCLFFVRTALTCCLWRREFHLFFGPVGGSKEIFGVSLMSTDNIQHKRLILWLNPLLIDNSNVMLKKTAACLHDSVYRHVRYAERSHASHLIDSRLLTVCTYRIQPFALSRQVGWHKYLPALFYHVFSR